MSHGKTIVTIAAGHLALALGALVASIRVSAIQLETGETGIWAGAISSASDLLLQPADWFLAVVPELLPLGLPIFALNSLAWAFALVSVVHVLRRLSGRQFEPLVFSSAYAVFFWLRAFSFLWVGLGLYLLFRWGRLAVSQPAVATFGIVGVGIVFTVAGAGLWRGARWAKIALLAYWLVMAVAAVTLLALRDGAPAYVFGSVVFCVFALMIGYSLKRPYAPVTTGDDRLT